MVWVLRFEGTSPELRVACPGQSLKEQTSLGLFGSESPPIAQAQMA